jgi:hypothetical protein
MPLFKIWMCKWNYENAVIVDGAKVYIFSNIYFMVKFKIDKSNRIYEINIDMYLKKFK